MWPGLMMRIHALALAASLIIAAPAPAAAPAAATLPEWLAGNWMMADGAAWAEEIWTSARGGIMLGIARQGFGPDLESWETLRIVRRGGGLVLIVQQGGAGSAVEYPAVLASAESMEFANPSAKSPQRIRLWRSGQLLMSETSRIDGSEAVRMNFRPVALAD